MNSKKYISDAVVTESRDFKSIGKRLKQESVMSELKKAVDSLVEANKHLDQLKKLIFYGKNNLNLPLDGKESDIKINKRLIRIVHSVVGLSTESGELLEQLQKALNKEKVDFVNLGEEQADLFWYCAILCDELGMTFEDLMANNIAKLKERFQGKFTEHYANNRNLKKERKILNKIERKAKPKKTSKKK